MVIFSPNDPFVVILQRHPTQGYWELMSAHNLQVAELMLDLCPRGFYDFGVVLDFEHKLILYPTSIAVKIIGYWRRRRPLVEYTLLTDI